MKSMIIKASFNYEAEYTIPCRRFEKVIETFVSLCPSLVLTDENTWEMDGVTYRFTQDNYDTKVHLLAPSLRSFEPAIEALEILSKKLVTKEYVFYVREGLTDFYRIANFLLENRKISEASISGDSLVFTWKTLRFILEYFPHWHLCDAQSVRILITPITDSPHDELFRKFELLISVFTEYFSVPSSKREQQLKELTQHIELG